MDYIVIGFLAVFKEATYSKVRSLLDSEVAIYLVNKSLKGSGSPMILDGISRYGAHFKGISVISELPTF